MARYRRDKNLSNVAVTDALIREIDIFLTKTETGLNSKENHKGAYISFGIRFDGKGYIYYLADDLLSTYEKAKDIEHVMIMLETNAKNSEEEKVIVNLSNYPNVISQLSVESDNEDWVNAIYLRLNEILLDCKTHHSWMRSKYVLLAIQLLGVISFFVIGLTISVKYHTLLKVENSFLIVFLFFLLIFSNIWTYVGPLIADGIQGKLFPNIHFERANKTSIQAIAQSQLTQ